MKVEFVILSAAKDLLFARGGKRLQWMKRAGVSCLFYAPPEEGANQNRKQILRCAQDDNMNVWHHTSNLYRPASL
jgi:hypothetical protein